MDTSVLATAARLVNDGAVTVPFPKKEVVVIEAIEAFDRFLCQSISFRKKCTFPNKIGWQRRDDDEHKDFVHFTPELLELAQQSELEPLIELCEALLPLFNRCEQMMLSFVHSLDAVVPGFGLSLLAHHPSSRKRNVLRILRYDELGAGATIAKWHTDVGFLTLHVAESRPALRLRDSHTLYECKPTSALIFPGDQVS